MYNRLSPQTRFCLRKGKAVRRLFLTDRFTSFQIQQAPSTDAYPACTTVVIFAHFWAIEARRGWGGGGRSAPRVASRLPLLTWHQTSDVSMSSDIRVRHGILDIKHRTSDIGHRIWDIRHQTEHIGYQTSDFGHTKSHIGHRLSDNGHQTSEYGRRTSNITHGMYS